MRNFKSQKVLCKSTPASSHDSINVNHRQMITIIRSFLKLFSLRKNSYSIFYLQQNHKKTLFLVYPGYLQVNFR